MHSLIALWHMGEKKLPLNQIYAQITHSNTVVLFSSSVWANFCGEKIHYHIFKKVKLCSYSRQCPSKLKKKKKKDCDGEWERTWIDGSISIYPCRACDRRRRGIKIDLPLHNCPRSIINTLLKTYWGTEEWRMKLFCSPFVSVALPRCLLGNTVINAKQVH